MRRAPGWRVVAAVAVLLCCVSGFGFYSLSVYLRALTSGGGGFTLAEVSRATSLFLFSTGLAGVGAAALLARIDARLVIAGGAVVMACGLGLVGRDGACDLRAARGGAAAQRLGRLRHRLPRGRVVLPAGGGPAPPDRPPREGGDVA